MLMVCSKVICMIGPQSRWAMNTSIIQQVLLSAGLMSVPHVSFAQPQTNVVSYTTPSPDRNYIVEKEYNLRVRLWRLSLNIRSAVGLLTGRTLAKGEGTPAREIFEDNVVVGWVSNKQLRVGWPTGVSVVPGPARIQDVDIVYVNYEPDVSDTQARRMDRIQLQNVAYSVAQENSDGRLNCSLIVEGTDGNFFNRVRIVVTVFGYTTTSTGLVNGVLNSATRVQLEPRPESISAQLTLTQAKLGNVGLRRFESRPISGPLQEDFSLTYQGFSSLKAQEFFRAMKDGKYDLKLGLSLDEQVIDYDVQEAITSQAIADYKRCERSAPIRDFSMQAIRSLPSTALE